MLLGMSLALLQLALSPGEPVDTLLFLLATCFLTLALRSLFLITLLAHRVQIAVEQVLHSGYAPSLLLGEGRTRMLLM